MSMRTDTYATTCPSCLGRGTRNRYEWDGYMFSWKPAGVKPCGRCTDDLTHLRRWLGDHEEATIVGQLVREGSDQHGHDEASAFAAIDAMVDAGEWRTIAGVYERATGFNPFHQ